MAKIHDVTLPIVPGLPAFPGDPPPAVETLQRAGESPFGLARLTLTTHSGTHVDAPLHFVPGGTSVDLLPLEILMGKTRVVEIQSRERVERAELEALDLRDDLRVLLKTRMSGQLLRAGFQEDHVYLTGDAALYLAQAGLKLVGFDYLSLDRFGDTSYPAHHALLGAGVVVVEGLDLSEVEPGEYDMACLPLRVGGGDGAPARVVLRSRA
jgi:arylformamidase